jgi:hypothetical protein
LRGRFRRIGFTVEDSKSLIGILKERDYCARNLTKFAWNQRELFYSVVFPAALAAFHRALAAAAIFALDAALIFLLGFRPGLADTALPLLYFAHRALAAAAIAARPARLILCFRLTGTAPVLSSATAPRRSFKVPSSLSILSLRFAARRRCLGVR